MFKPRSSRLFFMALDLIGTIALAFGLILTTYGIFTGYFEEAIVSASLIGSGLSLLIVTHIGRALIHIAETNSAILEALKK